MDFLACYFPQKTANAADAKWRRELRQRNAIRNRLHSDAMKTAEFQHFDPTVAVEHLRARDKKLAKIIDTVGPFAMQLKTTDSVFTALGESIVYQQLTGKAAATIYGRLCGLFRNAENGPSPEQILRATDEKLRSAGLSGSKVLALRDLAQRTKKRELPTIEEIHLMDNEAIIERLTEVRGIGRWTVEMLLMFRLGRPDVLPLGDYGIRKGFAIVFKKPELPTPAELEKYGLKWAPYRSVASWYLWRAIDLTKKDPASRSVPKKK